MMPAAAPSSAALVALGNRALLQLIAQFQRGVPLLVHELVELYYATYPSLPRGAGVTPLWAAPMQLGDLRAVQLVCRMRSMPEYAAKLEMSNLPGYAVQCARLDVLQWWDASGEDVGPWRESLLADATLHKHSDVARWLMQKRPAACVKNVPRALARTAAVGDLTLLKELVAFRPDALQPSVLDAALMSGHWDVIRFLHNETGANCTVLGMNKAAENDRLDVVKFLHENRTEGCTTAAMDAAALHGNLELVRFLHENRPEGCTTKAMDRAAGRGHLDVVRFLHENRSEGCTISAMDDAAEAGHLEVVTYLHERRTEGCTEEALTSAATNGHVEIVKFLHEKLTMDAPEWLMRSVLTRGSMELTRYLHEAMGVPLECQANAWAAQSGNAELIEYVKKRTRA